MQKYNCKKCGAELYWSSDKTALACDYCGSVFPVSEYEQETECVDAVISNEMRSTDGSIAHYLVEYSCEGCGAKIVTAASTVSTTCAYCGRAITVVNEFASDFNPDVIIPFRVNKENAKYIYQQYLKKNRLRKKFLRNVDMDRVLYGVYIPCWLHTFDIECIAGLEGRKYTTARGPDGREKYFSDVFFLDVEVESVFDNIPIDSLTNIKDELVHGVEPFNFSRLQPYHPAYMAGYYAEKHQEEAFAKQSIAQKKAFDELDRLLVEKIQKADKYSEIRIINSDKYIRKHTVKYCMLPVWFFYVDDSHGQRYHFAINGDTGHCAGDKKVKTKKSKLYLWGLAGLAGVITYLLCWLGGL